MSVTLSNISVISQQQAGSSAASLEPWDCEEVEFFVFCFLDLYVTVKDPFLGIPFPTLQCTLCTYFEKISEEVKVTVVLQLCYIN